MSQSVTGFFYALRVKRMERESLLREILGEIIEARDLAERSDPKDRISDFGFRISKLEIRN